MKWKIKLLSCLILPVSVSAAPFQGVVFSHEDWDTVCDNTGTCRVVGYQAEDDEPPISVLLTRAAGERTAIQGKIQIQWDGKQAVRQGHLWLNGRDAGSLTFNAAGVSPLSAAQVQALVSVLPQYSKITVQSGGHQWRLSSKGAAAAFLKADDVQQRLNTPSAWIRKGNQNHAVLSPQPKPVIHAVAVPRSGSRSIQPNQPQYAALLKQLRQHHQAEECNTLQKETPKLTIYPLNQKQVLLETMCYLSAYQSSNFYALMDSSLRQIQTVWAGQYGGGGGFDPKTGELSGSFKSRGLGDCWESETAVWNGQTFVQKEKTTTGQCRSFGGGAWDLPIWVSDVKR